ncbi:MAG TPA: carboxypeptidase-like regulatory domain-containing protein, partial [Candidatus Angelobacter sp.]|nr:carboxypeptidase-like regulatory domain-containing protein [Candidatus Angelobacter sp.]
MKSINWLMCVFLCVLSIAGVACGQGVGTSGAISGTVVDPTGAVVEKATVRAVETAKGIQHSTVTDHSGQYRFSGLPPAVYSVTVEAPGFATEVQNTVVVTLGETASADFHLTVAAVSSQVEVVEVQAQPSAVDTQLSSQSNTLGQMYINELPIDRRDYLTFTLLMPGVSESSVIADSRSLREKQVPQSGLSFYGNNGRGNDITVDGGTFNGYSGFVIANVSQDAVQEFQINRSNYAASLGSASGASINIVTKSGGNKMHGALYGFFRNDALDARDPFAFNQALSPGQPFALNAQAQPVKNALSRQQFGGTIGLPIRRDKTFFFAAYEGLLQDQQASVPLMLNSNIFGPSDAQAPILGGLAAEGATPVPCRTGQPAVAASVCAGILQNILTANPSSSPLKQFIVNQFETNGGLLPFPRQSHQFSSRLDHIFNDTNQGTLRYVFAHLSQSDPAIESLTGFSQAYSELTWTNSLQGSWVHTFNANMLNEFRAQWNINQYNFMPNDPGGPTIAVTGFGSFGRNLTLPNISTERDYEFADNFTHLYGKHMFQMGVKELLRGNRTASSTFLGGDFIFGN